MTAVTIARRAAHAAFWSVFRRPPGWNEPRNYWPRFFTMLFLGLVFVLYRYAFRH